MADGWPASHNSTIIVFRGVQDSSYVSSQHVYKGNFCTYLNPTSVWETSEWSQFGMVSIRYGLSSLSRYGLPRRVAKAHLCKLLKFSSVCCKSQPIGLVSPRYAAKYHYLSMLLNTTLVLPQSVWSQHRYVPPSVNNVGMLLNPHISMTSHVHIDKTHINMALFQNGLTSVWFYLGMLLKPTPVFLHLGMAWPRYVIKTYTSIYPPRYGFTLVCC